MPQALLQRVRSIIALCATVGMALGLTMVATPQASAASATKKEYLQLLVAQEKLAYDVFTQLAQTHPRGPFRLLARAEKGDLERMRGLLRARGWADLTSGDRRGDFDNFPLIEQTYFDMIVDGQNSIGDGARVGIALQQMGLGVIYQVQDFRLSSRESTQLRYSRVYSSSRMGTLWATIARYE